MDISSIKQETLKIKDLVDKFNEDKEKIVSPFRSKGIIDLKTYNGKYYAQVSNWSDITNFTNEIEIVSREHSDDFPYELVHEKEGVLIFTILDEQEYKEYLNHLDIAKETVTPNPHRLTEQEYAMREAGHKESDFVE